MKTKRTRRIDDINRILFLFTRCLELCLPITERCRTLDGDTLLAFKLHTIHLGADIILSSHLKPSLGVSFTLGILRKKERKKNAPHGYHVSARYNIKCVR